MKVWFVIYCKSQKDDVAERSLLSQGFEVYRPLIERAASIRKNNTKDVQKKSLFPRYLFLKVDPEDKSLTPIQYSPGVVGFVKFGDRYSTVDESIISNIKQCESEQQLSVTERDLFSKGEPVYINGKGFTDIKATFCEMYDEERVVVLLNMLGGMSTMLVPSTCVSRSSAY